MISHEKRFTYSWFWSCWLSCGVPICAIIRCIDETVKWKKKLWRHTFSLNFHFYEKSHRFEGFFEYWFQYFEPTLEGRPLVCFPHFGKTLNNCPCYTFVRIFDCKQREWAFLIDIWKIREIVLPDWMNVCWKCRLWSFLQSFAEFWPLKASKLEIFFKFSLFLMMTHRTTAVNWNTKSSQARVCPLIFCNFTEKLTQLLSILIIFQYYHFSTNLIHRFSFSRFITNFFHFWEINHLQMP